MTAGQHVALIRGINVGGRNSVPMAELREACEEAGFESVRTYIQSGNVIYTSQLSSTDQESAMSGLIEKRFGFVVPVLVRSHRQMKAVVDGAPEGFHLDGDLYHRDVIFLRSPLTASRVMAVLRMRDGVDEAWAGKGAVYFRRLSAQRTKSRMSSIVGTPEYQSMSIRNWSTTTKLVALLDQR